MRGVESRIKEILAGLAAIPSFASTSGEIPAGEYLAGVLGGMDYFKNGGGCSGLYPVMGDYLNRGVVYGLVRGSAPETVVLMGHYDVVGIEDYQYVKPYAFDIERLPGVIGQLPLSPKARADLESGQWIFGRGVADMKAGVAIHLACLEEYSKQPGKGSLLFISVPDEEAYSAGMRGAVPLLAELKERFGLDYSVLLDAEPNRRDGGKHILPVGTGGKFLPVALAQGRKAHAAKCFEGLNPLGLMSGFLLETELCMDFSDEFNGEATAPPTWLYLKDQKMEYDASVPLRACGYFNVLTFSETPDSLMGKLRAAAGRSFAGYVERMKQKYEIYRDRLKLKPAFEIDYAPRVMSFAELLSQCRGMEGFGGFRAEAYDSVKAGVLKGELNYPAATLEVMNRFLDFSRISEPLILLGFAPPYYPAMSSRKLSGREGKAQEYFDFLNNFSRNRFGVELLPEEYTVGLSDCSYCAIDRPFDYKSFSDNTPLWGELYNIDFEAVGGLNIVSLQLGPWGEDYHQPGERVYKDDVFRRVPSMTMALINKVLEGQRLKS
jgi:arginine utilization protein RocB